MNTRRFSTVDDYIASYPKEVQKRLKDLRNAIRKAAPKANEKISYNMPAYTLNGMLLYFAAHTTHIGLYPLASGIEAFTSKLTRYTTSRGTVQFQHAEPFPIGLITQIVKYRAKENERKVKGKKGKARKRMRNVERKS